MCAQYPIPQLHGFLNLTNRTTYSFTASHDTCISVYSDISRRMMQALPLQLNWMIWHTALDQVSLVFCFQQFLPYQSDIRVPSKMVYNRGQSGPPQCSPRTHSCRPRNCRWLGAHNDTSTHTHPPLTDRIDKSLQQVGHCVNSRKNPLDKMSLYPIIFA